MSEYKKYLEAVGRCGYFDSWPNGKDGSPVEKMAIFPTIGGMENLKELAKSNNVKFEIEAKKLDGLYQECITFTRRDYVDFASKVVACYKIGKLKDGASKKFDIYVENFIEKKENVSWPKNRMMQAQWDELDKFLRVFKLGVRNLDGHITLVNYGAVRENEDLRSKASQHFQQYVDSILQNGETHGLPVDRMSTEEWEKLNREIKPLGIKLEAGGDGYMWFKKIITVQDLERATDNLNEKMFRELKARYPNVPDENLYEIVKSDNVGEIYNLLRYTLPGKEYKSDPIDWEFALDYHKANHIRHYSPDVRRGVPYDGWYVRQYLGQDSHPVPYENGGEGYHISLNVKVSPEVLDALDSILQQDSGRYIDYYKFPMFPDECNRRFDPITIYTRARNPELERMIAEYVAGEVRGNSGLIGEMVGRGVAVAPETSKKYGKSVGSHEADIILNKLQEWRARGN